MGPSSGGRTMPACRIWPEADTEYRFPDLELEHTLQGTEMCKEQGEYLMQAGLR